MNRFLFLIGFMIFAILTNSIGFGHYSVNAVQESTLMDHHLTDLAQPGDHYDSGKSKAVVTETQVLLIFLILCLAMASNQNASLSRRLIMLMPVFHQSNYVDRSLLNNQTNI
ncbi:hypothetical protein D3H55_11275 [Bacillus salacetis]|uniref:Uncharacterized protein n=1 Tax=Bacillus salacetis TaxID=2315464 RepID=A0A3A1R0U5_9BACI|nr:hypothetical protein [Bacillus salacetis]RIW33233.1 hypothetical protein D3H55_11275 [Bacillus salacetis]